MTQSDQWLRRVAVVGFLSQARIRARMLAVRMYCDGPQNEPCQLATRPSAPHAEQRQRMVSSSLMPVSTRRSRHLPHLKQDGPGVLSGRSKSEAWATTTAVRNSGIFRADPR